MTPKILSINRAKDSLPERSDSHLPHASFLTAFFSQWEGVARGR